MSDVENNFISLRTCAILKFEDNNIPKNFFSFCNVAVALTFNRYHFTETSLSDQTMRILNCHFLTKNEL